jgi:hypothetical protein
MTERSTADRRGLRLALRIIAGIAGIAGIGYGILGLILTRADIGVEQARIAGICGAVLLVAGLATSITALVGDGVRAVWLVTGLGVAMLIAFAVLMRI